MKNTSFIRETIASIPDFPIPGVTFRDVSPLLQSPKTLRAAVEAMLSQWQGNDFDEIAGVESRGFIFASAAAVLSGKGMIMIRKPGKLPGQLLRHEYDLEYGSNCVEMQRPTTTGRRILIMDDVLATGGTAVATSNMLRDAGHEVVGASFLIGLSYLQGFDALERSGVRSSCLITY